MPSASRTRESRPVPVAPDSSFKGQLRPGFAALAGLFLGLAFLKWGNPALLDHLVVPPEDYWGFVFQPWPMAWGYLFLGVLALAGLAVADWRIPKPRWLVALPLSWLAWQCLAALDTTDPKLTRLTIPYFIATVGCFYLGMLAMAPSWRLTIFWAALLGCFAAVLATGFQQQFGGLEAVRQHVYSQPGWENLPGDYLRRLAANRIFGTLFYPNALAGAILLLAPALSVVLAQATASRDWPPAVRWLATGLLLLAGACCLFWSKSKAGWLIALVLAGIYGLRLPGSRRLKLACVTVGVVVGLAAFSLRFAGYFQGGASSVGARLSYWTAAWAVAAQHPFTGTGPGTFGASYRAIKSPEAEMAMLAHNDYLQQAADSGFPGALLYLGAVAGSLIYLARRVWADELRFAVWLGVLGWALQSVVEFGLYVPAIGWSAFWFLGWLWGVTSRVAAAGRNGVDTGSRAA